MKKNIEKDLQKRFSVFQHENQKKILKSVVSNLSLPEMIRYRAGCALADLPRNASLTRLKNRCLITGRGRFLIGGFNLSRLMMRKLARDGKIPGIRKSSW